MSDDRKTGPSQPASGTVQNSITGSPSTAIQMRDLHHGNIYINSHVVVNPEPGQPTTGSDVAAGTVPPPVPDLLHVLVVDDDRDVLDDLNCVLQSDPRIKQVGTATDAAMALRYIRATEQHHQPPLDAWLLDVSMPGLSGLELAGVAALFAQPPSTVFVTASTAHAVDAFDLEAVDYLVKPVRPERVTRTIDRLMRTRPARRESATQ